MEKIGNLIPQRESTERVIDYARRLKRAGFLPSENMDASLYGIAKHQEAEEKKAHEEWLKKEHKCLKCDGLGVVHTEKKPNEWTYCLFCQGSGIETTQLEALAPVEIEFMNELESKDVHVLKLTPDIIHSACKWFELHNTKKEDKFKVFFSKVHMASVGMPVGDGTSAARDGKNYLVVSGFQKAWKSEEMIQLKKQGKEMAISEEAPF